MRRTVIFAFSTFKCIHSYLTENNAAQYPRTALNFRDTLCPPVTSKQCQISTEPLFTLHCSWKHIAGFPGPRNQSRGHQSNDFLMLENIMARTSFDLFVFGGSWFIFVTQFRWGDWILPVDLSIFFQRGNLSYFQLVCLFTKPQEKWIHLKQISICSTGTNAFCLE